MQKKQSFGKPIIKIYGRVKDIVLCAVCIAAAIFFYCAAQNTTIHFFGGAEAGFWVLCGTAILFLLYALYALYQFCHVLILRETGLELRTVFRRRACSYADCEFCMIDTGRRSQRALLFLMGTRSAGSTSQYEYVHIYQLILKSGSFKLKLSTEHFGKLEEKIQKFNDYQRKNERRIIDYQILKKRDAKYKGWI